MLGETASKEAVSGGRACWSGLNVIAIQRTWSNGAEESSAEADTQDDFEYPIQNLFHRQLRCSDATTVSRSCTMPWLPERLVR
ncbi:MAG: hypothetical protein BGO81_03980 [Devosia sp. 66-22]|nr:MAG: hypothetical protein BGO81_03980 [Devosia sp. 66-22]